MIRRTRRIQSEKSLVEKGRFQLAESDCVRNGLRCRALYGHMLVLILLCVIHIRLIFAPIYIQHQPRRRLIETSCVMLWPQTTRQRYTLQIQQGLATKCTAMNTRAKKKKMQASTPDYLQQKKESKTNKKTIGTKRGTGRHEQKRQKSTTPSQ